MSNYICRYPDGAAGFALLLLRLGHTFLAFGIAATLSADFPGSFVYPTAGVVALLLLTGFATRTTTLLLGVAVVATLVLANPLQQLFLAGLVGGCVAVVLIGPGAFSIDARRHGRRVVHLQTRPPDRGAGD